MTIRRRLVETPRIRPLSGPPARGRRSCCCTDPPIQPPVHSGAQGTHNSGYAATRGQHGLRPVGPTAPLRWVGHADNISAVMDGLGLESAAVRGGHVSSIRGRTLACHPGRVTHLVLDGCPVWDALRTRCSSCPAAGPGWWRTAPIRLVWNARFGCSACGIRIPAGPGRLPPCSAMPSSTACWRNRWTMQPRRSGIRMEAALPKVRCPRLRSPPDGPIETNAMRRSWSWVDGAVDTHSPGGIRCTNRIGWGSTWTYLEFLRGQGSDGQGVDGPFIQLPSAA